MRIPFCWAACVLSLVALVSCASTSSPATRKSVITQIDVIGKPKLESTEDGKRLTISGYRADRKVKVGFPYADWDYLKLNSKRSYRFTLAETRFGVDDAYPHAELLRVSSGSRVIYDTTLCRVHLQKLREVALREGVDLAWLPGNYYEIQKARFPNAGSLHPACQRMLGTETGWVCPVCDRQEQSWVEKHRDARSR